MYMIYVNVQTLERNKTDKFQSFGGVSLFAWLSTQNTTFKKSKPNAPHFHKKTATGPTVRDSATVAEGGGDEAKWLAPARLLTSVKVCACIRMSVRPNTTAVFMGGGGGFERGGTTLPEGISRIHLHSPLTLIPLIKAKGRGVRYCPKMRTLISAFWCLVCTFVLSDLNLMVKITSLYLEHEKKSTLVN